MTLSSVTCRYATLNYNSVEFYLDKLIRQFFLTGGIDPRSQEVFESLVDTIYSLKVNNLSS